MIATGKTSGRFIIGSGSGVNPGRLAGGAPGVELYRKGVFSRRTYSNAVDAPRPGGLIDKQQQIDPASTVFSHPFDGGRYRSTATLPQERARTGWNVTLVVHPMGKVPEIMPHERGTFFRKQFVPVVKTQFGANKSGLKSDTAFHAQKKRVQAHPTVRSSYSSEKIQNRVKPPSFATNGNLWGDANHSFIAGRPNSANGAFGLGRWETKKRSVV